MIDPRAGGVEAAADEAIGESIGRCCWARRAACCCWSDDGVENGGGGVFERLIWTAGIVGCRPIAPKDIADADDDNPPGLCSMNCISGE